MTKQEQENFKGVIKMILPDNFTKPERYEMNKFEYMRFFTLCNLSYKHSREKFFKLGDLKPKGNINAWVEEEQCAGHICRKIGTGIYNLHVIRDDGTVWNINLEAFKTVTPLDVWIKEI